MEIHGIGSSILKCELTHEISVTTINDVLFVPDLNYSVVSALALYKGSLQYMFRMENTQ